MCTLIRCVLLVTGLAAMFAPCCAATSDALYPVEITLSTTSDWTDVRVIGGTLTVESFEVVEGADATDLRVSAAATLAVSKALTDTSHVTVHFLGYLSDLDASWAQVWINKGHLGETSVSLLPRNGSQSLVRFTHSGVVPGNPQENSRTFSLRTSTITSQIEPLILPVPSTSSIGGQKVLAFYYPWYGSPEGPSGQWVHWDPTSSNLDATHVPAAGYYDSLDPETVRRHILEAKAAGIDGFIASWWGLHTFEDRAFRVLLDVAEEEDFLVTVYYESAQLKSEIVTDISTIATLYASSPAFLTVDGRPAIFFYVRVVTQFTVTEWASVFRTLDERGKGIFAIADSLDPVLLGAFQGLHTYNPVSLSISDVSDLYCAASVAARLQGQLFAATVLPGYEEAVPLYGSPKANRGVDGETYREYWAVARASTPNWILITSFNEWHEGSEIEPSVEFGSDYLEFTAEEAAIWRSGVVIPADPAEADRDGDGIPDTHDFCPDWPGQPETNGC